MPLKEFLTVKNVIFLLLVILLIRGLSQITVIAMLFFGAYIIAASLNPLVDKLSVKMKRSFAATVVLVVTMVIVFAFFVPVFFVGSEQLGSVFSAIPHSLSSIGDFILHGKVFGNKVVDMIDFSSIATSAQQVGKEILNQSIVLTMNVFQAVLFFLVLCMLIFYFMSDKDEIKNGYLLLFPKDMKEKASNIYDNVSKNVGGYVVAQILSMVAVGLLVAVGMLILKVEYPLMLGLISGVLDIIPLLGPTIAVLICMIMAYPLGILKIILVVIVFLVVQWITNNLVRPVIFGKFLNLHPLLIILSMLLAAQFLGIWGVILAPAIASLVYELFDELYIKTINKGDDEQ